MVPVTVTVAPTRNLRSVALYVDGNLLSSSLKPYVWNWNTTSVANGTHGLKAVATYKALTRVSSAILTVTTANAVVVPPPTPANVYDVPASINNTGAADVTAALQAWIDGVPNGTVATPNVLRFTGGTYRIDSMLSFSGRSNLVFESSSAVLGGNTTFDWSPTLTQISGFWHGNDSLRCWMFDSCTNITFRYLYVNGPAPMPASGSDPAYGAYPNDGFKAWSEASTTGGPGETEHMHGIAFYRCTNFLADRVKIDNCPGDGIATGTGGYEANNRTSYTKTSGTITGCDIRSCHREAVSCVGTDGLTITGCTFKRIGFWTIDLEPNSLASSNYNVTINGNTWLSWDGLLERTHIGAFAGSKYSATYPTNECEDLVISNNTFTGIACLIRINTTTGGGIFPFANGTGSCRVQRVTITGNVSATSGSQQELNQIDTLNVSGNTFTSGGTNLGLRYCTGYSISGSTYTVIL